MEPLANHMHPEIQALAQRLTATAQTPCEKLERCFFYVRDSVAFAFPANGDFVKASDTVKLGYGQCNTKATLLLALCRAAGLTARIHFSLISKEIQKGFFTGLAYWLLPSKLSHSWVEVCLEGQWHKIDTFINDIDLFIAARDRVKALGWNTGYSVALKNGDASASLNLDCETYQQMAAVTDDHGVWDDPADYYASPRYENRPDALRLWAYRRLIGGINRRVEDLRAGVLA